MFIRIHMVPLLSDFFNITNSVLTIMRVSAQVLNIEP